MRSRSDASLASLLLTSHLVERPLEPLTPAAYWEVHDSVDDLGSLLGKTESELVEVLDGQQERADQVAGLLAGPGALAFALEELEQKGLTVLSPFDDDYPGRLLGRLQAAAPPVLYVAGSTALLREEGLGIVGSRDIDEAAAAIAAAAATEAIAHDMSVISGGARGIDEVSMKAAFEIEGRVLGIIADSLYQRVREPEARRAIGEDRLTLVSTHKPTLGFTVGNAMARNKVIYGLAGLTFVVASDKGSGGTWSGATEALRRGFGPVAVWTGEGSGRGNTALIEKGAQPVSEIAELFEPSESQARRQLSLDF